MKNISLSAFVWVRLGEEGKKMYKKYSDRIQQDFGDKRSPKKDVRPSLTMRGEWAEFQLADLMGIFGPGMSCPGTSPFENCEIRLTQPRFRIREVKV